MKPYFLKTITLLYSLVICQYLHAQTKTIWAVGKADNSSAGMALNPNQYKNYLTNDFGWEDRYYIVGFSQPEKEWPYVLPGLKDKWAGTQTHSANVLFGIENMPAKGTWKLVIDLAGYNAEDPMLLKVMINGKPWEYQLPNTDMPNILQGSPSTAKEYVINIPIGAGLLHTGGNQIRLITLDGSWIVFDQVRLEGPAQATISVPQKVFVKETKPAAYQTIVNGNQVQPLLVNALYLTGKPRLSVTLDGQRIFNEAVEKGEYQFEVPMPAVKTSQTSKYEILCDGKMIEKGTVQRNPQHMVTPADYVDTQMGVAHSRWMIAPGPWMPFSMVKLAPDNQDTEWWGGYDPAIESVGTFSHIHEFTTIGLGTMPANGKLRINMGDVHSKPGSGYRSHIDKSTEESPLGYYKVDLTDYHIKAELASTTRASFQRYTYPKATDSRVMIDFQIPSEYKYQLKEVKLKKVNDYRIEGYSHQLSPQIWKKTTDQDYIIHFVIEFDQPIKKMGTWTDGNVSTDAELNIKDPENAGAYVEFDTRDNQVVQMRTGISYVSIDGASKNLEAEISKPFGWSFDAVVQSQRAVWNDIFTRLKITTNDKREKTRFYTNMYRAVCERNTYSDVDGKWVDASERVQQFKDPEAVALGCDAFWNTFWNLNQFWNLVTPEWSSRWVKSELGMYDADGWLAKSPSGMEYMPVMVAEHEVPLIVSAYQMGIRDFDPQKAFEASRKTLDTQAEKVGGGLAGNVDYSAYVKYKYVPYDKGRFSNSLEFSYDDWTLSQLAKALGKTKDYEKFADRGTWWKNVIDPETGYARMRNSKGEWFPNFDPFQSGHNTHYVEGNAWQLTYFVPQDVPGLEKAIGEKRFSDRLQWGFKESEKWRFNAPSESYWDYPVVQGNQQSMHFAFLFNWVKQPWLTQQWSRAIIDRYYGYGATTAYLGDEDQGQMSSWFVMAALGLFQTDGGCRIDPIYEIASPIFPKVSIDLGNRYRTG
jgi:predicted alpha-1,2-mannosidase